MPNLVGRTVSQAEARLGGQPYQVVEVQSAQRPGRILTQSPPPGARLYAGREVVLQVAVKRNEEYLSKLEPDHSAQPLQPEKHTGYKVLVAILFLATLVAIFRRLRPVDWVTVESPRIEFDSDLSHRLRL